MAGGGGVAAVEGGRDVLLKKFGMNEGADVLSEGCVEGGAGRGEADLPTLSD